jgi:hypothetical protein
MNRHQRRKAKAKARGFQIINEIDSILDVQVDAKPHGSVMISANPRGREIVEALWPDIEWTTDKKFASYHSLEWLFTHVRVLPLHPEAKIPTAPDALGAEIAMAIARDRVAFCSGQGDDIRCNIVPLGADHNLFATVN